MISFKSIVIHWIIEFIIKEVTNNFKWWDSIWKDD
nr:MAG TPA: hypothetical protein [Caudoviricetes sp.]